MVISVLHIHAITSPMRGISTNISKTIRDINITCIHGTTNRFVSIAKIGNLWKFITMIGNVSN